jgi:hypothetical protein
VPVAPRLAFLVAAAGLLAGGCAASTPSQSIVMVSGRDDHGLLERPAIALQRSPTDQTVVGSAQDGTFVRVVREEGSWLLIRTFVSPIGEGWVNDHDLRAVAVLDGRTRVRFRDARLRDDGVVEVLIVPVDGGAEVWVSGRRLREVGAG